MLLALPRRRFHAFHHALVSVELKWGDVRHARVAVQVLLVHEHHLVGAWSLSDSWFTTLKSNSLLANVLSSVTSSTYWAIVSWLLSISWFELLGLVDVTWLCSCYSASMRIGAAIYILWRSTALSIHISEAMTRLVVQKLLCSRKCILWRINWPCKSRCCRFDQVLRILVKKSLIYVQTTTTYNCLRLASSRSIHIAKFNSTLSSTKPLHCCASSV